VFEIAELGRKLSKKEFQEAVPALRTELLEVQRRLETADFPVLILLNGVEGAGKGQALNLLHEWMDARLMLAHALGEPDAAQLQRPEYWRFWMALPPKGRIGLYVGNWYTQPIVRRAFDDMKSAQFEQHIAKINAFEKALVDDGALVLKFWFHLSEDVQRKRLDKLRADPERTWRVTKKDRKYLENYRRLRSVSEHMLRETSTGEAPWTLIEGSDERYRNVTMARHVLEQIRGHLDARENEAHEHEAPPVPDHNPLTILDQLDLTKSLSRKSYERELERAQGRLAVLSRAAYKKGVAATFVFEGWDAGGKGGAIRRILRALDARQYRVIPIAAPTDEERAHHYLWRFWRHVPPRGSFTIYDRSWYGRVLVERVEGFATPAQWRRAYKEIIDFEEHLVEHGNALAKFWLHISPEEQLRRFEERKTKPWKQHKITDEDYRNRDKMSAYELAADEMIGRTSTEFATWTLVEANDKHHARIKVLQTVCDELERALDRRR
jgi:polyphosphate:AMP phosphotransferase